MDDSNQMDKKGPKAANAWQLRGDHRQRVGAERRGRTRSHLLRSALSLMMENVATIPSIEETIAAAGVSRGTFYKYFPSVEALIRELVGRIAERWVRTIDTVLRSHEDPVDRIAQGIRLAARLALHQPGMALLLGQLEWGNYRMPMMMEIFRRDIEEGILFSRFEKIPTSLAFHVVAGAAVSAMQHLLESSEDDDFSELAAEVALRALGVAKDVADIAARKPLAATEPLLAQLLWELATSPL